jgi:ankyrin repeat protein
MAKLCLARGADVDAIDRVTGDAPIHAAARAGNRRLVKLALRHGANMDARNVNSRGFASSRNVCMGCRHRATPPYLNVSTQGSTHWVNISWGRAPATSSSIMMDIRAIVIRGDTSAITDNTGGRKYIAPYNRLGGGDSRC